MHRSVIVLSAFLLLSLPAVHIEAEDQDVTWTDMVNVTVEGTILRKITGCDGCDWDGGAKSLQELTAGDGYVQFTVGEAGTLWAAGLSHGSDDTTGADIDFALSFNGGGYAEVRENGAYRGETPYVPGDVFRVTVEGGSVHYSKNGLFLQESATAPQYPLGLDVSLSTIGATVVNAKLGVTPPPPPGGAFTEKAGSPKLRKRFTQAQIEGFLPAAGAKGPFAFPAPYNTAGVRLTNASDCADGQDCLWYVGYSNWRNINNHVASADMLIMLGTDTNRGGSGPTLVRYNKTTEAVDNLGPLFDQASPYRYSTGEGWYFSGTRPTTIYTSLVGSPTLRRYDVLTRQFEPVPALDLASCPRPRNCPAGASYITQPHSSDNDLVHSATVQNADWQRIGCVLYETAARRFRYFGAPAGWTLDECHVDKSGKWLMLLETTSAGSRRNRVVNLGTGKITTISDVNGALGHLDMGFGYAVGADTFSSVPNATILLKFPVVSTQRPIGPVLHYNKRWDIAAANHVAHGNARAGVTPESQYSCGSNASRVADMADEIVCFRLNAAHNPDESLDVLVVGQVMTDLDAPGGGDVDGDDYEQTPKGNLDVTGRYFIWTTNLGGGRLDAFIVKIPADQLASPVSPLQTMKKR